MSTATTPNLDDVPLAAVPHWGEPDRHGHTAQFYGDDTFLLDELSRFIGTALVAGDGAVVIATKSHRDGIVQRLQARGFDTARAVEQGRYIAWDASETLATFMLDGWPDAALFTQAIGSMLGQATGAAEERILMLPPLERWSRSCGRRAMGRARSALSNSGITFCPCTPCRCAVLTR